jgi:hypothetical protein
MPTLCKESWQDSKAWADQFTPACKRLVGAFFIVEASAIQDQRENTDLWFELQGQRVAVRIRNIHDYGRLGQGTLWGNQWTIRRRRPSGTPTELQKILEGWGHYCLYAWGDVRSKGLVAYTLFDLNQVRPWIVDVATRTKDYPGRLQRNWDGTEFRAITLADMPPKTIMQRVAMPVAYPLGGLPLAAAGS